MPYNIHMYCFSASIAAVMYILILIHEFIEYIAFMLYPPCKPFDAIAAGEIFDYISSKYSTVLQLEA